MRIHSNILSHTDILVATNGLPGVYVTYSEHGSRSHARAFEVSLEGNGYRKNTGQYGAGEEFGATWDEWGVFLARLFDKDPNALAGSVKYPTYRDGYDFHEITGDRFSDLGLPKDTHKRHTWNSERLVTGEWIRRCKRCSASVRMPQISNRGFVANPGGMGSAS